MDKMTIHNVNLFYGDFHALKNVDLDIPERKSQPLSDLQAAASLLF